MNITFRGMQNVGAYFKENKNFPDSRMERIAIQLNNNGPNKDLDNFKEILDEYPNFDDSNSLDLEFKTNPRFEESKTGFEVYINSKKLPLEDKNLPFFAKIFKLVKRISDQNENIPVHKNYTDSWECIDRFYSQLYGKKESEQQKFLKTIHDTDYVAAIANHVAKSLTKSLNNYLNSNIEPRIYKKFDAISGFTHDNTSFCVKKIYIELNNNSKNKYQKILKDFPPAGEPDHIDIESRYDVGCNEPKIFFNGYKLNIETENFDTFRSINEILEDIAKTKESISLPCNCISEEHLDKISEGSLPEGALNNFYFMDEMFKETANIKTDVTKNQEEVQQLSAEILNDIKDKFKKHFS